MSKKDFLPLLGWIVRDMRKQNKSTGIEIGFMSVIAEYAICGSRKAKGGHS